MKSTNKEIVDPEIYIKEINFIFNQAIEQLKKNPQLQKENVRLSLKNKYAKIITKIFNDQNLNIDFIYDEHDKTNKKFKFFLNKTGQDQLKTVQEEIGKQNLLKVEDYNKSLIEKYSQEADIANVNQKLIAQEKDLEQYMDNLNTSIDKFIDQASEDKGYFKSKKERESKKDILLGIAGVVGAIAGFTLIFGAPLLLMGIGLNMLFSIAVVGATSSLMHIIGGSAIVSAIFTACEVSVAALAIDGLLTGLGNFYLNKNEKLKYAKFENEIKQNAEKVKAEILEPMYENLTKIAEKIHNFNDLSLEQKKEVINKSKDKIHTQIENKGKTEINKKSEQLEIFKELKEKFEIDVLAISQTNKNQEKPIVNNKQTKGPHTQKYTEKNSSGKDRERQ